MDDRFKEIKARADAASEYPWRVNTKENIGNDWLLGCVFDAGTARDDFNYIITTDHIRCSHMSGADAKDDATFIAHARADVPWLLKEVERLRAVLKDIGKFHVNPDEAIGAVCTLQVMAQGAFEETSVEGTSDE